MRTPRIDEGDTHFQSSFRAMQSFDDKRKIEEPVELIDKFGKKIMPH